jgi:hypothetical protein
MLRYCLLLGLAAPIFATPITGTFDFSANANYADIMGGGFVWQFHQGDSGAIYASCAGHTCSLDGSAAPDMLSLLKPENWFRASLGASEVQGNLKPGEFTGSIGGSFSWHVERTDWSDVASGGPVPIVVPMEISGLLKAFDAQGQPFMEQVLSGTGNFETAAVRDGDIVTFFGAAGRFDGIVAAKEVPNGAPVEGGVAIVPEPGGAAGPPASDTGSIPSGLPTFADVAPPASDVEPVPEPATWLLLGLGLVSFAALRRRFA